MLTNAVYAFTFGQYLGHVLGLGPWFPRTAGIAIVALFIGLNLRVITGFGAIAGAAALVALIVRLISTDPMALVFLGLLVLIAIFGRPLLLRHVKTERHTG